jgi:hypothetical protein
LGLGDAGRDGVAGDRDSETRGVMGRLGIGTRRRAHTRTHARTHTRTRTHTHTHTEMLILPMSSTKSKNLLPSVFRS